jgi:hypothetical protein
MRETTVIIEMIETTAMIETTTVKNRTVTIMNLLNM